MSETNDTSLNQTLERKTLDSRLPEMESREQVIEHVRRIHKVKLWKDLGYKSLPEFCERGLGYTHLETREILIQLGLIFPSSKLQSNDAKVQMRIDRLRAWRKSAASEKGIAAFRVIPNRTLMRLAEVHPQTLPDLSEIQGIGPRKLADFGEEILQVLMLS